MAQVEPTLVSCLTAPGPCALALIALRGPTSRQIAERLFRPRALDSFARAEPDRPYYGWFGDGVRDDVVVVLRAGDPAEVELHCHGGGAMVESLLASIEAAGAARVDAWEYLDRAGLGPIRLEAARALARCPTERGARILLDQYAGALASAFDRLARRPNRPDIDELLRFYPLGTHLVEPWRVLLFGPTNAGKSSLLNALAGFERAISSELPGTTRDLIDTVVALDGWPVRLIDGAGLRATEDSLEREGQKRVEWAVGTVDLRVLVLDTAAALDETDRALLRSGVTDVAIGNKCDLACDWPTDRLAELDVRCSAKTGEAIEALIRTIADRLVPIVPAPGAPVPFTARHRDWLEALRATV